MREAEAGRTLQIQSQIGLTNLVITSSRTARIIERLCLKSNKNKFIVVYLCASLCVYVHVHAGAQGDQKMELHPLK